MSRHGLPGFRGRPAPARRLPRTCLLVVGNRRADELPDRTHFRREAGAPAGRAKLVAVGLSRCAANLSVGRTARRPGTRRALCGTVRLHWLWGVVPAENTARRASCDRD